MPHPGTLYLSRSRKCATRIIRDAAFQLGIGLFHEKKTGYLLLLKMSKSVFALPRTCRDIVGSIEVICFEYHNPPSLAKDYSMNEKMGYLLLFKTKECVLTFPESCSDIVGSVEVIC